ncbi:MAG: hypothetical protein IPL47_14200 [Phyllobacteriaceae bacterium]|nr:hypothetical protein [Phyllobacteriaceae bacterium]
MLRDHAIENSPSIDSASFDKPEFSSSHKQLANASGKAEDDGKAPEEFRRVMERRERQRQTLTARTGKAGRWRTHSGGQGSHLRQI